jgi:starvation-inducible DNA-binding protein
VIKADNGVPGEDQMLANLAAGNEAVVKAARAALMTAEEAGDQATADIMTQRVSAGEKAAWMLRAHVAK